MAAAASLLLTRPRVAVVLLACLILAAGVLLFGRRSLPPVSVTFSQSAQEVEPYDFIELTARVSAPRARNPFLDASIHGTFAMLHGNERWQIDGFCDAEDGTIFRVRFMPRAAGDYAYSVEYRQGWSRRTSAGSFRVSSGRRRGPVRIDPQHLLWSLESLVEGRVPNQITVASDVAANARVALNRMLEISN